MKSYLTFLYRCFRLSFEGSARYHLWLGGLFVLMLVGLNAYCRQFVYGLGVTGLTDQVSWGAYIANFTFLVGVAASAVMIVIPVYVYKRKELKNLVIFGELLAVSASIMCLLFIMVDLGRPDQAHHLLLRFNFPISELTWDVIALNGFLLLSLYITGYKIYSAYCQREPKKIMIIPFIVIFIGWAIFIHSLTALLYSGLNARPFWTTAILAPRFLASAFAAGPALLILTVQVIRKFTGWRVENHSIMMLRSIVIVALAFDLYLFASDVFSKFHGNVFDLPSLEYLYFGLDGAHALVPWIWTSIVLNVTAMILLLLPSSRNPESEHRIALNLGCMFLFVGVWIEKGMGLIVPAFIPTPLGEIVEYIPTRDETLICLGIWATGILIYTILVRVTIPVLRGELTQNQH